MFATVLSTCSPPSLNRVSTSASNRSKFGVPGPYETFGMFCTPDRAREHAAQRCDKKYELTSDIALYNGFQKFATYVSET